MRLPFGLRWWELLPEAVLALGLGLFAVTETSAATSAFRSTKAIVLMAVVAVGWLALRFVLVRYTRLPVLRVAVFGVAALGVLRVVVFPAYSNTTVVETLPVATVVTSTTTSTPPVAPAASQPVTPTTAAPATTVPPTTVTTTPAGPVALRSGSIQGIDHRASGQAVLYQQPDGSYTVGLEDIDIQPGPDYDVFVVPGANREDKDGGTRLDDLRGNKGTQYYAVPPEASIGDGEWTVLVWCQTFDVPVAAATPA